MYRKSKQVTKQAANQLNISMSKLEEKVVLVAYG